MADRIIETTAPPPEGQAAPERKGRLWNVNFVLLWQGQFVSSLGDTAYSIALGFWVLAVTGSTALMGALMATTALTRVVVSPFAGVIVDRTDRKWMIVATDAARGVVLAGLTGGMFVGYILMSVIHVRPNRRFAVFYGSAVVGMGALAAFPLYLYFPLMFALAAVFGLFNAVLNALVMAVLQMTTPQNMRGKVFGLLGTLAGGLTPLAMALGGVLAEFISIRLLISASFILTFLSFLPLAFSPAVRRYVNFDPDRDTLEAIS